MSIPPWDRAIFAAVRFPERLSVRVIPRDECLGAAGLYGVTVRRKGSIDSRAWKTDEGIDKGSEDRKGRRTEGAEVWSELWSGLT